MDDVITGRLKMFLLLDGLLAVFPFKHFSEISFCYQAQVSLRNLTVCSLYRRH